MIAKANIAAALFLAGLATPALAGPQMRCFSAADMINWRSPDGRTIYLHVNAGHYYRLDLARQCGTLKSIHPHLVLRNREGNLVCSALDLDVRAGESPAGITEPCFLKTITELSPAEVAALPKDAKP